MGQTQFEIAYVFDYIIKLLPSLKITLLILGSSIILGVIIGFVVALPRLYRVPLLGQLSQLYVSFFRGTPILIQLFLFYYGVPELLTLISIDTSKAPALLFVILTYSLHSGAYIAELIRGAVSAVDRGQVEAAYAIGMNGFQAFSRIVLPQALAISIPIFANVVIANLKDTSLAFTLGVMEITGKAKTIGALSHRFIEVYLSLAIIYFIISFFLAKIFVRLEKRLTRHESTSEIIKQKVLVSQTFIRKFGTATGIRRKEAKQ
ncbi:amino acid ABC transporter permease [Paenibacillus sp. GSMTC-2017]|uniref:amino acid ABC transporter permease n=1 Tax=Paenibacillus sp. GSMTC-2017 TaxID=2794350 RepID=UPI0018D74D6D|nr:amino acid ABC transporter permease [Paenibacillus sp. GSMTC-2017]MBH5317613.1 amino acid ABC transporter permease [Paenibacillus sp. GSMTC-2017]